MTSPFFSIIIPVYKVEKYLRQCVDSVLAQSYTNFEVILVDDGSPDSCPQICDEYGSADHRIFVVHKCNGGLSSARNVGLSRCSKNKQNHYVIFIDSDDFWIGNDVLQKLAEKIMKFPECDFYGFNCSYYYQKVDRYNHWREFDENITMPIDTSSAIPYLVKSGTIPMSAWSKVLSYDFLIAKGIKFIDGIYTEDIPWFIDILENAKKCMFINLYAYGYRQQVSSSITSSSGEKGFNDLFKILRTEVDLLEKRKFDADTKKYIYSFLAYEFCILLSVLNRVRPDKRNAVKKELFEYKWLLHYEMNPQVKKVSILYKLIGLRATRSILTIYQQIR
jgi:glycosyltransferase involved in cell wall biosynthesis